MSVVAIVFVFVQTLTPMMTSEGQDESLQEGPCVSFDSPLLDALVRGTTRCVPKAPLAPGDCVHVVDVPQAGGQAFVDHGWKMLGDEWLRRTHPATPPAGWSPVRVVDGSTGRSSPPHGASVGWYASRRPLSMAQLLRGDAPQGGPTCKRVRSLVMLQDPLARIVANWNSCIRQASGNLTIEDIVEAEVRAEVGLLFDGGLRCHLSNMYTYALSCECPSCRTWSEYDAACPDVPSTVAHLRSSHARHAALTQVDQGKVMVGLASEWHASVCTWLYLLQEPAFADCGCGRSPWRDEWTDHSSSQRADDDGNALTTALLRVTLGLASDDLALYSDLAQRFTLLVHAVERESGRQLLGCPSA